MVIIGPQRQSRKEAYNRTCFVFWRFKDMQRQNGNILTSPNDFVIIADDDIQKRPPPTFHLFRLPQSKVDTIEGRWHERLDNCPNRTR
jgi:hypothetical protein